MCVCVCVSNLHHQKPIGKVDPRVLSLSASGFLRTRLAAPKVLRCLQILLRSLPAWKLLKKRGCFFLGVLRTSSAELPLVSLARSRQHNACSMPPCTPVTAGEQDHGRVWLESASCAGSEKAGGLWDKQGGQAEAGQADDCVITSSNPGLIFRPLQLALLKV